jgi:hypothetical protein
MLEEMMIPEQLLPLVAVVVQVELVQVQIV